MAYAIGDQVLLSGRLATILGPARAREDDMAPRWTIRFNDDLTLAAGGGGVSEDNPNLQPLGDVPSLSAGPSFAMQVLQRSVLTMPEAGADLRDFGGDLGGGDVALAAAVPGVVAAGALIGLRALLARLPIALRSGVEAAIKALGGVGTRIGWNRLPSWVQQLLIFSGITAGIDILIDTGPDDRGLIPLPGTSDLAVGGVLGGAMPGLSIVRQWTANGVQFIRLSDGRVGARNKLGIWKVWKPKKPIVLFSGGAGNLRTFLRADAALDRQSKRLKTALNRRAPRTKRAPKAVQGQVVAVDGVKLVRNG